MVGIGLLSALFRCQDPARTAGRRRQWIEVLIAHVGCAHTRDRQGYRPWTGGVNRGCNGLRACPPLRGARAVYRARMDLGRMREIACGAVQVGADVVRGGRAPASGEAKGLPGDWVTEVDLASERAIAGYLASATPEIPFSGEELGGATAGLRWVVDPLDGTTNFVHGFWAVGVSVALVDGVTPVAGAIAAPFLGDLWHAAAGGGAVWVRADGVGLDVPGLPPASRRGCGCDRVPVPAQGTAAALPGRAVGGPGGLRGPAPARCGVPGPRLDRVRGVRRVLRARAIGLGRGRRRAAGAARRAGW